MKKVKILGISGSIRSNYKNILLLKQIIHDAKSQKDLNELIKKQNVIFSNTDISIAHSLFGAKENGAEIEILSITKIFEHKNQNLYENFKKYDSIDNLEDIDTLSINQGEYDILLESVKDADGLILGTPVYFGDRSSVANKLLQLTQSKKLLKDKAFGVVSAGAKRNGGQETTNIYALYEALMQEAVIVGNGPKTCQYGGTVFAGDVGNALGDDFGMETCYGVGRQVSQLAKILVNGKESEKEFKPKLSVVISMDTEDFKYETIVKNYFYEYSDRYEIEFFNLIKGNIYRCVACGICPSPFHREKFANEEEPYHCIVQSKKDSMSEIQKFLLNSDAVVLMGVNSNDNLIYRYQAFMERTRFIRRDDFQLTNIPIISFFINEAGATNNPIHNVKVLTSFIRHNMFILKPVQLIFHDDRLIYCDSFEDYSKIIKTIKNGRENTDALKISYKATGYSDKTLDNTIKERK